MVDFNSGLGGAFSGAASGGSLFGIPGAIAGGFLGGISGLFSKKKKPKRISTLDPQQQALYGDYISSLRGQGPFSDLYNFDAEGYNNVFDQTIGRPAYRSFQENMIPSITGQFRSGNLMNSSYAGQSLARAGRDVQESLDAQRSANIFSGQQQANMNKQNAINNILGMQTFAMQRPEDNGSSIDQILKGLAPQAGKWFENYLNQRTTGVS